MDAIRSKGFVPTSSPHIHTARGRLFSSIAPKNGVLLGTPHEYLEMLEECANVIRTRYVAILHHHTSTPIRPYGDDAISSGNDVLTEANLTAEDLEAYCDVLTKVGGTRRRGDNSAAYEPTIVVGTTGVQREQILRLAFAGHVLGQVQGTTPAVGHLRYYGIVFSKFRQDEATV